MSNPAPPSLTAKEIKENLKRANNQRADFADIQLAPDPSNPLLKQTQMADDKTSSVPPVIPVVTTSTIPPCPPVTATPTPVTTSTAQTSASLAAITAGQRNIPAHHPPPPPPTVLHRGSFETHFLNLAAEAGVMISQPYLDDVWTLCNRKKEHLTLEEQACYLAALRLANQLNPMMKITELNNSLTQTVANLQRENATEREQSKILSDRVNNLTAQIQRDYTSLGTTYASIAASESGKILDRLDKIETALAGTLRQPSHATSSAPQHPPSSPSTSVTGEGSKSHSFWLPPVIPTVQASPVVPLQPKGGLTATASRDEVWALLMHWQIPQEVATSAVNRYGGRLSKFDYGHLQSVSTKSEFLTLLRQIKDKYPL